MFGNRFEPDGLPYPGQVRVVSAVPSPGALFASGLFGIQRIVEHPDHRERMLFHVHDDRWAEWVSPEILPIHG